ANPKSRLVKLHLILGRFAIRVAEGQRLAALVHGLLVPVVEPVVRIESGVAPVVVTAARELVRSRSRREFDLNSALSRRLGPLSGGRDRHLLNGIKARADQVEKAAGAPVDGRPVVVVL